MDAEAAAQFEENCRGMYGADGAHRDHPALGALLRLRRRPVPALPARSGRPSHSVIAAPGEVVPIPSGSRTPAPSNLSNPSGRYGRSVPAADTIKALSQRPNRPGHRTRAGAAGSWGSVRPPLPHRTPFPVLSPIGLDIHPGIIDGAATVLRRRPPAVHLIQGDPAAARSNARSSRRQRINAHGGQVAESFPIGNARTPPWASWSVFEDRIRMCKPSAVHRHIVEVQGDDCGGGRRRTPSTATRHRGGRPPCPATLRTTAPAPSRWYGHRPGAAGHGTSVGYAAPGEPQDKARRTTSERPGAGKPSRRAVCHPRSHFSR